MFHELSADNMAVTQDLFFTDYTFFDNKNGSFDGDEFKWKSKDTINGNSHLWHQKILFLALRLLVFNHVELHQRFLVLVQQSVHGVM